MICPMGAGFGCFQRPPRARASIETKRGVRSYSGSKHACTRPKREHSNCCCSVAAEATRTPAKQQPNALSPRHTTSRNTHTDTSIPFTLDRSNVERSTQPKHLQREKKSTHTKTGALQLNSTLIRVIRAWKKQGTGHGGGARVKRRGNTRVSVYGAVSQGCERQGLAWPLVHYFQCGAVRQGDGARQGLTWPQHTIDSI